ncbi:hypothetical protein NliqN6_4422 [Naganishia liquefaciens]|uniref:Uncharacterized protein n=1 Tax=Naganishia liquefaciens TaxID=104408 RepID=A0A8H3TWE9_9TREE|nr:hypothetical protein NliqN6_4422 [Naganishia liquefaciens]
MPRSTLRSLLLPLSLLPLVINAQGLDSPCAAFDNSATGPSAQCASRKSVTSPSDSPIDERWKDTAD